MARIMPPAGQGAGCPPVGYHPRVSSDAPQTYFRKGFGLKAEIEGQLTSDYHSDLVVLLKASGNQLQAGDLTLSLAQEFGFCYGVDRAIDYAYETRQKFPDKRIHLIGEIIHNPGVNDRLREMGVIILGVDGSCEQVFAGLTADDVVIVPAFGVTAEQMEYLREIGCVHVDTTCGSVLNVWKRVERYARDGFTSVIHGKHYHEETRATAPRALAHPDGRDLVVRDMAEAEIVMEYIRGNGNRSEFLERFGQASSPGFDPDFDLERLGLANQTTMLSSESLAIAERLGRVVLEVHGEVCHAANFRSFDTICSATQDRQDAVLELLNTGVDAMLVIGGYNSSNTGNLARICAERVPTWHVAASSCIREDGGIEHLPPRTQAPVEEASWLPQGPLQLGITAGASTPNSEVGAAIGRVLAVRGLSLDSATFPLAT
jgi:4-hydroxy-3-methylbut-2-enyl diphosphate reductase